MIEQSNAGNGEPELKKKLPANLLLKRNSRDKSKIYKAKRLLIAGTSPGLVALMLRLPLETVTALYEGSYNPRSRQLNPKTQAQQSLDVRSDFEAGATLETLCSAYSLPLITIIRLLQRGGVDDHDIASRMPPPDHQLMMEHAATIARGKRRKAKGHQNLSL